MSHKSHKRARKQAEAAERAPLFAALGDPTRLLLIGRLADGRPRSITSLTGGSTLSRQAITKHLRVLERAGMVRSSHAGRESLFRFDPEPLTGMREYLDSVSRHWDEALARLKTFVEE
jgi:DNA-binding transcriptional ArsR family regulator